MKAIYKTTENKKKTKKDKEKVQKWKSVDFFDREGSSPSIPMRSKKKKKDWKLSPRQ
jgi:hypothetical protein